MAKKRIDRSKSKKTSSPGAMMYGGKRSGIARTRRVLAAATLAGASPFLYGNIPAAPLHTGAAASLLGYNSASNHQVSNALMSSKNKKEKVAAKEVNRLAVKGDAYGGIAGGVAGLAHGIKSNIGMIKNPRLENLGIGMAAVHGIVGAMGGATIGNTIGNVYGGHKTGFGQDKLKDWKSKGNNKKHNKRVKMNEVRIDRTYEFVGETNKDEFYEKQGEFGHSFYQLDKDHYKTLGLRKDASAEDIKRAFRLLSKKYHPDLNKDPKANEMSLKVNKAYEILSDSNHKKVYDDVINGKHTHWAPKGKHYGTNKAGGTVGGNQSSNFHNPGSSSSSSGFHSGTGGGGFGDFHWDGEDFKSKMGDISKDMYKKTSEELKAIRDRRILYGIGVLGATGLYGLNKWDQKKQAKEKRAAARIKRGRATKKVV